MKNPTNRNFSSVLDASAVWSGTPWENACPTIKISLAADAPLKRSGYAASTSLLGKGHLWLAA
jgi:hypothetical protein